MLNSSPEDLARGLKLADIRHILAANHPRGADLNAGNVTQALHRNDFVMAAKTDRLYAKAAGEW